MNLRKGILAAALAAAVLPSAAAAQDLTVGMPTSPPNVVHMPVYLAQELGLYKKYGLNDVKIVSLNGGVNVFRAMLAGNLDIGMSPATVVAVAKSRARRPKASSPAFSNTRRPSSCATTSRTWPISRASASASRSLAASPT